MEDLRLHDAIIFLVAAGLIVPLAKRLRINPILGFLLVGMVVGPHVLTGLTGFLPWLEYLLITNVSGVRALAELGVVFLLFMIGLELSFSRLWSMRRLVFGMGSAQILVTALVVGVIAYGFGNTTEGSVILGLCLALSSTAVVMQLLTEQGRFATVIGHGSFAILLAQDIAVVPILFVVGVLGASQGGSVAGLFFIALVQALLAVVMILLVGRYAVRPLFRFVASLRSPELFMAVTLLLIIATAATTHAAGLSAALGSFLAGLLIAESEFRHEVEVNIEPFKGLLLGLFFVSVGMSIDPAMILADPLWITLSVLGLFTLKTAITFALGRLYGYRPGQALEMGMLLGQGGEFAFVVVGMSAALSLLPTDTAQFMLIVVGATMFLTPMVARLGHHAGSFLERRRAEDEDSLDVSDDITGHMVIVGYGRTGRTLAALFDQQKVPHIGVEMDAQLVGELRRQGAPVILGDAGRSALLEKAHLDSAAALVVATDSHGVAERVVTGVRALHPDLPILVRAHDRFTARRLMDLGATVAVQEVLEAGLQLGMKALEKTGLPTDVARALVENQRLEASHESDT